MSGRAIVKERETPPFLNGNYSFTHKGGRQNIFESFQFTHGSQYSYSGEFGACSGQWSVKPDDRYPDTYILTLSPLPTPAERVEHLNKDGFGVWWKEERWGTIRTVGMTYRWFPYDAAE